MTNLQNTLAPPSHLSPRSKSIWQSCDVRTVERLALLQAGLESLDRADEARRILELEGMTTTTERSGVKHLHPMCRVERDSRAAFIRIWESLGLNESHDLRRMI